VLPGLLVLLVAAAICNTTAVQKGRLAANPAAMAAAVGSAVGISMAKLPARAAWMLLACLVTSAAAAVVVVMAAAAGFHPLPHLLWT
jgi:hypothetical protein